MTPLVCGLLTRVRTWRSSGSSPVNRQGKLSLQAEGIRSLLGRIIVCPGCHDGGLQRGCSQLPPLLKRYPSRLRAEYLDTDVICSCIQVFVYTLDHDFHVTPRDECINEPIAALPQEVVVGEAEAAPVIGVVRQVEVPGDVSPTDRPGLVRVCL